MSEEAHKIIKDLLDLCEGVPAPSVFDCGPLHAGVRIGKARKYLDGLPIETQTEAGCGYHPTCTLWDRERDLFCKDEAIYWHPVHNAHGDVLLCQVHSDEHLKICHKAPCERRLIHRPLTNPV